MEVAFWLLLSLGIAIFFWLCWRNIQRSRHERINKVLTTGLTIAALMAGQTAWAQDPIGSISYNAGISAYEIANKNNLKDLAVYVNGSGTYSDNTTNSTAHNCEGLTFKVTAPIAFTPDTDWNDANSIEDTYTPIGTSSAPFKGTFDGQNNTISGIRIYKTTSSEYLNLGLFGYMGEGGTVKDVNLSDVRISGGYRLGVVGCNSLGTVSGCHISNAFIEGKESLGGIAGQNTGAVSDCHVSSTVTINANTNNAQYLGGIVGYMGGSSGSRIISGCISSATLTIKEGVTGCKNFGGIVGNTSGDSGYSSNPSVTDCFAMGVTVPATDGYSGAIAGIIKYTTFSGDYYYNCTVAGIVNVTNKPYGSSGSGNSGQGDIKSLHVITFGPGLSGSGGIDVNGDTYYAAGSTVTLSGSTNGYTVTKDGTNPAEIVTVNESGGVYTFTMPATNVTVSGPPDYAGLWNADADHDGSSEEKAYIITTTAGLKLLADVVNTGNDQSGVFFKLGGNIEYTHTTDWNDATSTENNYIVIGNGGNRSFCGTFDGQGYTISGIRIYRDGKNYTGLFGDLNGGTVKNVRLADARITGSSNIGGIAGYNSQGTVMNCTVASDVCIHAAGENHGGIVGKNSSNTHNHKAIVTACTSSAQLTVATGASGTPIRGGIVGYNSMSYTEVSNCLVLGASVLGWGDSDNCKYLGAIVGNNSSGTLSNNYYSNCTVGNASSPASTNVGAGSDSGKGDVTTNDGARGVGTITLGTGVSMTGGTTVTVGSTTYYYAYYTGNVDPYVITLSHSDAPTGYSFGGYSSSDVTISNSSFTMPATNVTVNATWRKLLTNTDIAVSIPAQTYSGSALTPAVTVTDGTTELTKDTHYTVTLPDGRINAGDYTITITGIGDYDGNTTETFTINPKETDYGCITYTETGNATTSTIVLNGDSETSLAASIEMKGKVTLKRTFTKDTKSTICLPFDVTATKAAALGKFYQFDGLKDGTTDIVKMVEVTTGLVANTPYIFEPSASCATIDFGEQTITASPAASTSTSGTSNEFTFQGTYNYKKWQEGADELTAGIYGFLAKEWNNHASGYFLKGVANTTIKPFRAYLKYTGADLTNTDPATNATRGSTRSGSLPEVIEIEWVNAKGETTGIRSIDNGQWIIDNSWYSLDGRRLNGKPTTKGLYINNGRKVVIK